MCLALFAWQVYKTCPLLLAANRDEFHTRPSLPLAPWRDAPQILGGRDLEAGGSWLACHADGRFAALTNVREGVTTPNVRSRGELIANYLQGNLQPDDFIQKIEPESYAGFNLLLGSRHALFYLSNRNGVRSQRLSPGIYGLSNHRLETPWPKLLDAKRAFAALSPEPFVPEDFFALLGDRRLAADRDLPQTGVPLAVERLLSAIFIVSPDYGTRASTLLYQHPDGQFDMIERRFGSDGVCLGETQAETGQLENR